MQKKINLTTYWILWSIAIMAIFWMILVHQMRFSHLIMIPVAVIYLIINALIFNSYYLGLAGTYYLYRGKTDKAFMLYEKAIKKNTRNVHALYHWALRLLQEGEGKEALAFLEKAQRINTNIIMSKNITLAIGSCYWTIGDIDKAIETIESLINNFTYVNASVLTTIGYLYFLKENYDLAEEYSLKAVEDNSEHSAAWDNLGQIYYAKKDYPKSKEYFAKALEYKNTMVDSLFYMGKISELENNKELAKEYFEKASKCNISALNTVTKEQVNEMLKKYS